MIKILQVGNVDSFVESRRQKTSQKDRKIVQSILDKARPTAIAARAMIGKDPELVETVGLGNLKVTTARGIKDDGNTKL